jgi:hypothetical protein
MRTAIVLLALSIVLGGAVSAQDQPLTIPAAGLANMEQGTVEFWLKTAATVDSPKGWGTLLALDYGTEKPSSMALSVMPMNGQVQMRVGFVVDGQELKWPFYVPVPGFAPKKWVHVAVTWTGGNNVTVYFDGKPVMANVGVEGSFNKALTPKATLSLGMPHATRMAIDDLRISSVARRPEELGFSVIPLKADDKTLYLANFENMPEGKLAPAFAAAEAAKAPVSLLPHQRLMTGRDGKSLAFCDDSVFNP